MTRTITREELRAAIDDGTVTVVDALPAAPRGRRHIPDAHNPLEDEAESRAAALLPDKDATIVTYSTDAHCGRGETLAGRLAELGYTYVRVYREASRTG